MKAPRDPTRRFSDRAHDDARHRPRYPAGPIPALRRSIGRSPEWVIADLGSSTGISAEPFLRHGNTAFASEHNNAMRPAAERHLPARFPNFRNVTPEQLHRDFGGPHQRPRLANAQRFDFEGLRGRLLSSSYVPPAGDPRADAMLAAPRALFDQHAEGGFVVMSYKTQVYVAPVR